MTRDEHRAKCIEAMIEAGPQASSYLNWKKIMTAAFDAIRTADARVDPVEATEEMIEAGELAAGAKWSGHPVVFIFSAMSAAGDLTNPPEGKP